MRCVTTRDWPKVKTACSGGDRIPSLRSARCVKFFRTTAIAILACAIPAHAGDLNPSSDAIAGGLPGPSMKSLLDIYRAGDSVPKAWSQKHPTADERFEVAFEGDAARDRETGLVWERFPVAQVLKLNDAALHCWKQERSGRQGWRLPTAAEFMTLFDRSPTGNLPAFSFENSLEALQGQDLFVGIVRSFYWTSSALPADPSQRIVINTGSGQVEVRTADTSRYPWCVRAPE